MNRNKFLPEWYEENWELEEDLASLLKKKALAKKVEQEEDELEETEKAPELTWSDGYAGFVPKRSMSKLYTYYSDVKAHGSRMHFKISQKSWENIYNRLLRSGYILGEELRDPKVQKLVCLYSDGHIGVVEMIKGSTTYEEKQLGFFSGVGYELMQVALDYLFEHDSRLSNHGYLFGLDADSCKYIFKVLRELDGE